MANKNSVGGHGWQTLVGSSLGTDTCTVYTFNNQVLGEFEASSFSIGTP